ncbi:hypothetical protein [Thermoflavimicrobium dichotomicum]|uniref:Uncharacterized protein n=1 Tax=Thermoflavimicrobium dichotomicum TaxID=46223 RepID=A0A1I3MK02_9BACL|nr:hypothetical protein [Thermoflavimicrobium dichotomicum]SFI97006.1 hypothetical protein SAMN05421852_10390 [Thermoflavimicrobium dichotomicum]
MPRQGPSIKDLTQMINSVMGHQVLTEQQLQKIMAGAKIAHQKGGMNAVLEYLMHVTQADVDKNELRSFADSIQKNPQLGMDILQGKKNIRKK